MCFSEIIWWKSLFFLSLFINKCFLPQSIDKIWGGFFTIRDLLLFSFSRSFDKIGAFSRSFDKFHIFFCDFLSKFAWKDKSNIILKNIFYFLKYVTFLYEIISLTVKGDFIICSLPHNKWDTFWNTLGKINFVSENLCIIYICTEEFVEVSVRIF